jgi:hypothetical protein
MFLKRALSLQQGIVAPESRMKLSWSAYDIIYTWSIAAYDAGIDNWSLTREIAKLPGSSSVTSSTGKLDGFTDGWWHLGVEWVLIFHELRAT